MDRFDLIDKLKLSFTRFMMSQRLDSKRFVDMLHNSEKLRGIVDQKMEQLHAEGHDTHLLLEDTLGAMGLLSMYNEGLSAEPLLPEFILEMPVIAPAPADESVLSYLSSFNYKEADINVANPIKYLSDRLSVAPDDATEEQLIEAMLCARVAEPNKAANAKSEFRARSFKADEMVEALTLLGSDLPKTKKGKLDYVKSLCDELKAEKGEYFFTTGFLKNEKMATASHYGAEHTQKIAEFVDTYFND